MAINEPNAEIAKGYAHRKLAGLPAMECLRRQCERWGSLSEMEADFGSIRRPKARVSSKVRLGSFSKKTETHCEQITLTEAKWVDFDRMKFGRKWDQGGGESNNPGHESSNWGSPTPRKTQRLVEAWVCGEGMTLRESVDRFSTSIYALLQKRAAWVSTPTFFPLVQKASLASSLLPWRSPQDIKSFQVLQGQCEILVSMGYWPKGQGWVLRD